MIEIDPGQDLWSYRKWVTQKYGYIALALAIGVMVVIVLGNTIFSTTLFIVVNQRPTKLRRILLQSPWLKILLWTFCISVTLTCILETNNWDLIFISKRFGRVCVALMPPMYFVTLYPSPLPRSFYLQLLPVHKYMSRLVVLFGLVHGVMYTYVYYKNDVLNKLQKWPNIYGILALLIFGIMAITSIYQVRRKAFELFYQIHIIGAWITLPLIKYHARPHCDYYLAFCLLILIYQVVMKLRMSFKSKLRVQHISQSLLLVTIPKDNIPPAKWSWPVASHLRLSGTYSNPLNWIRSTHPYTIASLPDDDCIKLVVRPGDYKISLRKEYSIFGPHACIPNYFMHQIHLCMTRRVLIVVGGAGISFGAPLLRYLKLNGAEVKMVWAIRDLLDAKILPQLGLHDAVLDNMVEIYYTGNVTSVDDEDDIFAHEEELTINASDNCCVDELDANESTSVPRQIRKDPLLAQYANFLNNARPHLNLRLKSWLYGYSVDDDDCCCADRILDSCEEDRLGAWVVSCGNKNLTSVTQKWAERAGVGYFQDTFTL